MKFERNRKLLYFLLILAGLSLPVTHPISTKCSYEQVKQHIDIRELELSKRNFLLVCDLLNIRFPEIVYSQAVLESGFFKSNLTKKHNNILGLYDSRNKDFFKFKHWTNCLEGYKSSIQNRLTSKHTSNGIEGYFLFLHELGYAEDPDYLLKVKQVHASQFTD